MIYLYTDTQGNQLECKHKESIFDSVLISLSRGDKVQIQYSTKYPEYQWKVYLIHTLYPVNFVRRQI